MTRLKALLVGAGGMGKTWAKTLRDCDEVEIAGWIDIRAGAAGEAIENLHLSGVRPFDDLAKALAETRPDFLVDVTVPEAHREVTLASLRSGVPVLGEKPMADSMAAAREMVAACERAGKLYMVSQSRRYDGRALAFREAILKYAGDIGILCSDFFLGPHFGGFREAMPSPLLLDMAIHTFDSARQISGRDPVAVYCRQFNPAWSWFKGDASATALFEMTGGLQFIYNGSWCRPGPEHELAIAMAGIRFARRRLLGRRKRSDRRPGHGKRRVHSFHRKDFGEGGPRRPRGHRRFPARIHPRPAQRTNSSGRMP